MRFRASYSLLLLLLLVTLVAMNAEGKKNKKQKGCKLNGKFYKAGTIAYRDRSHCLILACVKEANKRGRNKFSLRIKKLRNCECGIACPMCVDSWDPVCGTNNETYTNYCTFQGLTEPCGRRKAEILHYGECGKCPTRCPETTNMPVCGSDGRTYDNKCRLYQAVCSQRKPIHVAHWVRCEDVSARGGHMCKYNGKKYRVGRTIAYIGGLCLHITCQQDAKTNKPTVVFGEFRDANCSCNDDYA